MKLFLISLFFLLAVGQDEPDLSQLIEDLSDDRIDVRDEAERKLIQQGISIVETLEERSSHQEEEVRARLEEVILLIRRIEWAKRFNPGPSSLTLSDKCIDSSI